MPNHSDASKSHTFSLQVPALLRVMAPSPGRQIDPGIEAPDDRHEHVNRLGGEVRGEVGDGHELGAGTRQEGWWVVGRPRVTARRSDTDGSAPGAAAGASQKRSDSESLLGGRPDSEAERTRLDAAAYARCSSKPGARRAAGWPLAL